MKKLLTFFAVCSAVSIFLCDSYATNNSEMVGENEMTLNDTEDLEALKSEINAVFQKKYPDLFECFYHCAKYNIHPFRVKQIRDYVMGLSPDFVKIQCLEENVDIDRCKRGWAEICSMLSEFDNEIDIDLNGSLDAYCLWDTIYKKDNYKNFEMSLIDRYRRGEYGDYCTIDRYYLHYCYSLAKRLYMLAEKAFEDKKNKDFCTYIEATQVFIALVLHYVNRKPEDVRNAMMEEDRRWGPDFMKYLYCCAKSGIDPTTNENVRKFLAKNDADFTKLDLNEDTFDWDKIEEAWDQVIGRLEYIYDVNFFGANIKGDVSPKNLWTTLFEIKDNTFVNVEGLFEDFFLSSGLMGLQTKPEVGIYSVNLAISLFDLAGKANKESNIQAAIVYLKAAQVFVGLGLDDGMAGLQL